MAHYVIIVSSTKCNIINQYASFHVMNAMARWSLEKEARPFPGDLI